MFRVRIHFFYLRTYLANSAFQWNEDMNDNNWIYKSHYKNAYIITIYELKTAFNDFKEEFVNRIREKIKIIK